MRFRRAETAGSRLRGRSRTWDNERLRSERATVPGRAPATAPRAAAGAAGRATAAGRAGSDARASGGSLHREQPRGRIRAGIAADPADGGPGEDGLSADPRAGLGL